jgi:hypothetical protein
MEKDEPTGGKRTDVGYKRPPIEHQFKPGQKPPPRKEKSNEKQSTIELLVKILNEEQRVEIGGAVRWCTKAELIVLRAFQLAEKGSGTVSRALWDLLMLEDGPPSENDFWISLEPDGEPPCLYRMPLSPEA